MLRYSSFGGSFYLDLCIRERTLSIVARSQHLYLIDILMSVLYFHANVGLNRIMNCSIQVQELALLPVAGSIVGFSPQSVVPVSVFVTGDFAVFSSGIEAGMPQMLLQ